MTHNRSCKQRALNCLETESELVSGKVHFLQNVIAKVFPCPLSHSYSGKLGFETAHSQKSNRIPQIATKPFSWAQERRIGNFLSYLQTTTTLISQAFSHHCERKRKRVCRKCRLSISILMFRVTTRQFGRIFLFLSPFLISVSNGFWTDALKIGSYGSEQSQSNQWRLDCFSRCNKDLRLHTIVLSLWYTSVIPLPGMYI